MNEMIKKIILLLGILAVNGAWCSTLFPENLSISEAVSASEREISRIDPFESGEHNPIIQDFRVRILQEDQIVDFHVNSPITIGTVFPEWNLLRPLFQFYVENPTEANVSEFESILRKWKNRHFTGMLIKTEYLKRLQENPAFDSTRALDLDFFYRDLPHVAQTEKEFYEEFVAALDDQEKLSRLLEPNHKLDAKRTKERESKENITYFVKMLDYAEEQNLKEIIELDERVIDIAIASRKNDRNYALRYCWPTWTRLIKRIQQVGGINSEAAPLRDTP